ncbi:MAG: 2-amino-4-hydroxy-6-hydroxymethyldihydropteridine diphosphokinase, partial [Actinobacteria bacterium]|nr:2-amino-4-hydroxy-6-hydroxymethyldihydropteridine diphosphokinase [Actinomycetota bacterium]
MRAFLGLGSNVGDRWAHLRRAAAAVPDLVRVSPVYETEPVGGPSGQGRFLNAIAELETSLEPHQLL